MNVNTTTDSVMKATASASSAVSKILIGVIVWLAVVLVIMTVVSQNRKADEIKAREQECSDLKTMLLSIYLSAFNLNAAGTVGLPEVLQQNLPITNVAFTDCSAPQSYSQTLQHIKGVLYGVLCIDFNLAHPMNVNVQQCCIPGFTCSASNV